VCEQDTNVSANAIATTKNAVFFMALWVRHHFELSDSRDGACTRWPHSAWLALRVAASHPTARLLFKGLRCGRGKLRYTHALRSFRYPQRGPRSVMQVGIITRHTNLWSHQVRVARVTCETLQPKLFGVMAASRAVSTQCWSAYY